MVEAPQHRLQSLHCCTLNAPGSGCPLLQDLLLRARDNAFHERKHAVLHALQSQSVDAARFDNSINGLNKRLDGPKVVLHQWNEVRVVAQVALNKLREQRNHGVGSEYEQI